MVSSLSLLLTLFGVCKLLDPLAKSPLARKTIISSSALELGPSA
jgi:hypothetical protein